MNRLLACTGAGLIIVFGLNAQLYYTTPGSTLTENFDSLPYSGSTASWTDNSTLPGWFLIVQNGTVPTQLYIGDGSGNTGAFYSFGLSGSTERALGGIGSGGAYFGSPASGALAGYWGVKIVNNSGVTLYTFAVTYDMEQWRNSAATSAQPLISQWAIDATSWLSGTWYDGATTDSPVTGGTAGALNGNLPANRVADVSFTANVVWQPGQTLWIRFRELNDPGNDHGLAIDNFRLVANVPEPGALAFIAVALGLSPILRRCG